ncbi:unnamed protein product [Lactuca virosa]|uniref:Uncharacterized protein n=1 Tax=Lactuca virosa TaxID=75947 RepID=A0AAU9LE37_9ASTR|nr:unnamed protein product [Lactuca virosa]
MTPYLATRLIKMIKVKLMVLKVMLMIIYMRTVNLGEDDKIKEGISDDIVDKLIGEKKIEDELIVASLFKSCAEGEVENPKTKKDGQVVVEGEGGEFGIDLAIGVEDDSNKNKDKGVETIFGVPIVSHDSLEYWYDPD